MILRLDVEKGHPLPDPQRLHAVTQQLLIANLADLQLLEAGDYDVTPRLWTSNTHTHELKVFDTGEGLYRMHPKTDHVGTLSMSSEDVETADTPGAIPGTYSQGGAQQPINAESAMAVIAGGHPSQRGLHIFGLIAYSEVEL